MNATGDVTSLPTRIGRYRILGVLGKGGMGIVYLAEDEQLLRKVALKTPSIEVTEQMKKRFLREARAAAILSHSNICPVYDIGEINGQIYLTMGYIEGKNLSQTIAEGPLGQPRAARFVSRLALALAEAHARGIIHRDIKPANIMINQQDEPILTDFGLARQLTQDSTPITQSGVVVGTPSYMAPEQVNGDVAAQGPCTDIYSLGTVFYEMLTGRPPFVGQLAQVLDLITSATPEPPSRHRPDLAPELEKICLRALARNPADRFASMTELAQALDRYLHQPPASHSGKEDLSPAPFGGERAPSRVPARAMEEETLAVQLSKEGRTPVETIKVSGQGKAKFRSLNEAIQNAVSGSRIVVEPGLYRERLFITRPVEIVASGARDATIIESAGGACLVMNTDYAVVRGLSLHCRVSKTGKAYPTVDIGQGQLMLEKCTISSDSLACVLVHGESTDPILRRCLIRNSKDCGLLFMNHSRGTLEDCDISGNSLPGVEIKEESSPLLRRCRIRKGKAVGVLVWDHGRGTLEECEISANALAGVEIKSGGDPVLQRCTMRDSGQCGIFVWAFGQGSLDDCKITGNRLSGIEVKKRGNLTVRRCILAQNRAYGMWVHESGSATVTCCLLFDNAKGAWKIDPDCQVQRSSNRSK